MGRPPFPVRSQIEDRPALGRRYHQDDSPENFHFNRTAHFEKSNLISNPNRPACKTNEPLNRTKPLNLSNAFYRPNITLHEIRGLRETDQLSWGTAGETGPCDLTGASSIRLRRKTPAKARTVPHMPAAVMDSSRIQTPRIVAITGDT